MNIPPEFINRVQRTNLSGLSLSFKRMDEIRKQWPGSDLDVVYENGKPIVVLVFESEIDKTAYILKYGNNYV